ncbi:MAG: DUF2290 domain-containing protein [Magnetococcales bacterium]|nr:DUF2290 domain-containing protein [Magnetococcales bacterium]MBF0273327.1 DUF2290 domain-containing protein [Magnetococcales bacterium]
MPTTENIFQQMEKLTADLVGLSLCDRQNFPSLRDTGKGYREIGIGARSNISYALRNISYHEIYEELDRTQTYNLRMLDGALIQMMYRFKNNQVESHRLAFFPSPFLEEFQNNPDIYLEDEIYSEVIMKSIVPFPLRFDFDSNKDSFVEVDHPRSHLTLGGYENCRIPVNAPLTPFHFIGFILRNFYNTAYHKYYDKISFFTHHFEESITIKEMNLLYIHVPAHTK